MLRLRSDEQLVALFRRGNEEAFRAIHDRYRARLFAYARQMLSGSRQDAEDALQDVFVRAYHTLRESDREISLRAWLYRVAHNRCVDELRRPAPPAPEVLELVRPPQLDPIAEAERRESLRRLVADVRRLPEQQRSALLMRELNGLSYAEVATALGTSVPSVKSLLVRARVSLAQAGEARDTECPDIRAELALAHDEGARPSGLARRHLRDCPPCTHYRGELQGTSRNLAAFAPGLAPLLALGNLFGAGAGAGGGSGAAAGGGAALGGSGTLAAGAAVTKVAAVVCVAVATAGGAVEVSRTLSPGPGHKPATAKHHGAPPARVRADRASSSPADGAAASVVRADAGPPARSSRPAARHFAAGHPSARVKRHAAPAPATSTSDAGTEPTDSSAAATTDPSATTGADATAPAGAPGAPTTASPSATDGPSPSGPDAGTASAPGSVPTAAPATP